jgi:hypothetical protein
MQHEQRFYWSIYARFLCKCLLCFLCLEYVDTCCLWWEWIVWYEHFKKNQKNSGFEKKMPFRKRGVTVKIDMKEMKENSRWKWRWRRCGETQFGNSGMSILSKVTDEKWKQNLCLKGSTNGTINKDTHGKLIIKDIGKQQQKLMCVEEGRI